MSTMSSFRPCRRSPSPSSKRSVLHGSHSMRVAPSSPLRERSVVMAPQRWPPTVALPIRLTYCVLVHAHAQPRGFGAQDVSVGEGEDLGVQNVVEQFGVLVVVDADALFLDEEVGCGKSDLEARGQGQGTEWTVGGHKDVVGLGQGGDPSHLGDPSRVGEVGLGDRDTHLECGQEVGPAEQAFPGRDGYGLHRTTSSSRCPYSGRTGSSTNMGRKGSNRGRTLRAVAAFSRPWKSTATSRSGPSTSRTPASRSTMPSISRAVAERPITPEAFIFTAVKPDSTRAETASDSSSGSSTPNQPYTRARSRTGPPRSWCTGTPKHLPAMSHSAWSSPATALDSTGPPR